MQRIKLTIEYDGTPFAGWQRQSHAPSVQAVIEEALKKFYHRALTTHVAGRTDAGVHALGQVAHFDAPKNYDTDRIRDGLNFYIQPNVVSVLAAEKMDEHFHARLSAKRRYYEYHIHNRRPPLSVDALRAWHVSEPLDVDAMREGAKYLIGEHDFTSFRDAECQAKSPIRTLYDTHIEEREGGKIILYFTAKSFLHHQVRTMVGTLKNVGKGKWKPKDVKRILEACDRQKAGQNAPAHGLYFMRVDY